MAAPFNPYAPPVADVEKAQQVGIVARDGKLVRMDRNGQLPERCIACNGPARAKRVSRTLYWSRWEWRLALWGVPAFLLATTATGNEFAIGLFFWSLPVLVIANMIIRRRLTVEIGLCARHLRNRHAVSTLIWICCGSAVALPFVSMSIGSEKIGAVALALLASMLVLGLVHGFSGASRVGIKRLSERHVWLKGVGAPFRNSLPEASAD